MYHYKVYGPLHEWADFSSVRMAEDATVNDLMVACDAVAQDHTFFKYGGQKSGSRLIIYNHIAKWLRDSKNVDQAQMTATRSLRYYFPHGPTPSSSSWVIDIVIVNNEALSKLRRVKMQIKGMEETERNIDSFLATYDPKLREYLAGPPWKDFWIPPSSANRQTADFITDLKIPQISGDPVLLLHKLGEDLGDQSILDEVFAAGDWILFNTSGSGKTRFLFEGLCRYWGFYFTLFSNSVKQKLGSNDMMDAIDQHIPNTPSFILYPEELSYARCEDAYCANKYIMERHVYQVLRARILVFERFLRIARDTGRPIEDFKIHWLFLQLCSLNLLGVDVFAGLSEILHEASEDDYPSTWKSEVNKMLVDLRREYSSIGNVHFILDEAQVANERLDGSFRSRIDESIKYTLYRPLINSWMSAYCYPVIISGSSPSILVVNNPERPEVATLAPFTRVTRIGAFDDFERQRSYIRRYMPHHIAKTDSGEQLLERAWNWVRGRRRLTEALVEQLLMSSFRSPHRVLNSYIKAVCGFSPTDGQRFVEEEEDIPIEVKEDIVPFKFSRIDATKFANIFRSVLFTWLIHRRLEPLSNQHGDLVGFARLVNFSGEELVIDEPLVILGATQFIFGQEGFSLEDSIRKSSRENRADGFGELIAYYLARAFDDDNVLCDIFDFGMDVPEWAKQRAQLISAAWSDEGVEVNRFHASDFRGSPTNIGARCDSMEETKKWFESPASLMCLPDNLMGPNIVSFVRLATGQNLAIAIQCKWLFDRRLHSTPQVNASKSVRPSNFYNHPNLDSVTAANARGLILNQLRRLNMQKFESDGWFEDGVPVLGVIASYPTEHQTILPRYCASLNMDRCAKVLAKADYPGSMGASLGIKRKVDDHDIDL